ncbi:MAG: ketoacyl-ACP synthase III [Methylobacillus glycogenes]|nr:ketoacyl-ACP synthase III [Methylobacillus glycogenes]
MVFSDLAQEAGEKLIAGLGWDKSSIDVLLVVTQSPDYPIPATAIILQDKLGLSHGTVAFDINLGCSGYAYGLFVLGSMLSAHGLKRGIMLVGDKSSNPLSLDNGLLSLFGDAATATALEFEENAPPMYFNMGSDGSGHRAIIIEAGGQRVPIQPHHLERLPGADGISRKGTDVILDGPSILNFSIREVPASISGLVEYSPFNLEDIDYFVLHQANRMINETIRKKLGLAPERVPLSLKEFGNTSSASIPVTMTTKLLQELGAGRKRLLLSGFGVGLSWASCILEIEDAYLPALIEI